MEVVGSKLAREAARLRCHRHQDHAEPATNLALVCVYQMTKGSRALSRNGHLGSYVLLYTVPSEGALHFNESKERRKDPFFRILFLSLLITFYSSSWKRS